MFKGQEERKRRRSKLRRERKVDQGLCQRKVDILLRMKIDIQRKVTRGGRCV